MKRTFPCMAMNIDLTGPCHRPATKDLAPTQNPWVDRPVSIRTVRLCGVCARRLGSGSRSLQLQLLDGTRHTLCEGDGVGMTYVYADRGEA